MNAYDRHRNIDELECIQMIRFRHKTLVQVKKNRETMRQEKKVYGC